MWWGSKSTLPSPFRSWEGKNALVISWLTTLLDYNATTCSLHPPNGDLAILLGSRNPNSLPYAETRPSRLAVPRTPSPRRSTKSLTRYSCEDSLAFLCITKYTITNKRVISLFVGLYGKRRVSKECVSQLLAHELIGYYRHGTIIVLNFANCY